MGLGTRTLALVAGVVSLVAACGSRTGLFSERHCNYPDEAEVLALVNDTKLAPKDYVTMCGLTSTQARSIVSHRRYESAEELDALPELNTGTCATIIDCAREHAKKKVQEPCTPNSHPNVVLELVVDESGSMMGEKWNALRDSLLALFDDIAADNDSALSIGVVMFDDIATTKVEPAPLTQADQLDILRKAIDKPTPHGGGTGTINALNAAYEVVNDQSAGRSAVVLFSDGSPTGGDEEKKECEIFVKNENFDHGTQLFSVGIGPFPSPVLSQYDPSFMGRLAIAGATAPKKCIATSNNEAEVCHYQITPGGSPTKLKDAFGAALDAIRETATTCP